MAVVKIKTTEGNRRFWPHVEAIAEQLRRNTVVSEWRNVAPMDQSRLHDVIQWTNPQDTLIALSVAGNRFLRE